jgi:heterodisulfide reductase subunit C
VTRERFRYSEEVDVDVYKLVDNLRSCLACGKCVGNCPVARLTPSYNSRQIIRDVLSGNSDRWLRSEEIWRCLWCANCYTVCPMDINYPLLMLQLRYKAMESGYGMQYIAPFKKFALRAREDGLTFAPGGEKGRARVMRIRSNIGAVPWPEISDKAKAEYKALFDLCGTTKFVEDLDVENPPPLDLAYRKGRIA